MPDQALVVGTTEIEMIKFDSQRISLEITNTHATAVVIMSDRQGNPANSSGRRIYPRQTAILTLADDDKPYKQYWIISDTATTTVALSWEVKN